MQTALNEAWEYALGMFEKSDFEDQLIAEGIFGGEEKLKALWLEQITPVLEKATLKIPASQEPKLGGRKGYHTEHLDPLLKEMAEVFNIDPAAEW
jgi:ring-1,2-phenylacetyl-CoA epoxidase subunit PaaC